MKKKQCIGCHMRQQELDQLKKNTSHDCLIVDVFLSVHYQDGDTLIHDPSQRLFQHFIKDPNVYQTIISAPNTYSLNLFSSFLKDLLSHTLDEDLLHKYETWQCLFHFLQKQQVFWCMVSLQETFGDCEFQHSFVKKKKIIFYF